MKFVFLFLSGTLIFFNGFGQVSNVSVGLWSNPATWNVNRVPLSSDIVVLAFDVTVDANSFCRSLDVNGHNVTIKSGFTLTITGNYTSSMLSASWKLYGYKSDTANESSPWVLINYDTVSAVDDYYCIYVPDSNKNYFSPYK